MLIESGASVSAELLHDAISEGHLAVSKLLVDNGADIYACIPLDQSEECECDNYCTALSRAADSGYPGICSLLLDSGAHVESLEVCRNCGECDTPIETAAFAMDEIVRGLLKKDAQSAEETLTNVGKLQRFVQAWIVLLERGAGIDGLLSNHLFESLINMGKLEAKTQEQATQGERELGMVVLQELKRLEGALCCCPLFYLSHTEVTQARERIKTALLVFYRQKAKPPREIRHLLLCSHPELERDLICVFLRDLCKGKTIGAFGKTLLMQKLPELACEKLKEIIARIVAEDPEVLLQVNDPISLVENSMPRIRESIQLRIAELCERAKSTSAISE